MKKLIYIFFLSIVSFSVTAQGFATFNPIIHDVPNSRKVKQYTRTCLVQYYSMNGWSDTYNVKVTFISGTRLNESTGTYDYSTTSTYAAIFWSSEQTSVIKITSPMPVWVDIDPSTIANSQSYLKGTDQTDRTWRICSQSNCF